MGKNKPKMTAKQIKIAAVAKPKNKIDPADFKALRKSKKK